jgi:Transposase IS200 like
VPKGLIRIYGQGDWHYITCSCYRRLRMLGSAESRDLFLQVLEETRKKYAFVIAGYVVMPEHFHLLIGEPKVAQPLGGDAGPQTASLAPVSSTPDGTQVSITDQRKAHVLATAFL